MSQVLHSTPPVKSFRNVVMEIQQEIITITIIITAAAGIRIADIFMDRWQCFILVSSDYGPASHFNDPFFTKTTLWSTRTLEKEMDRGLRSHSPKPTCGSWVPTSRFVL